MRVEAVFLDFLKTLAFFFLIRVLRGRCVILKIDASEVEDEASPLISNNIFM
jgi:hypothetical protein